MRSVAALVESTVAFVRRKLPMNRFEPLRWRMHEMVDTLFDDLVNEKSAHDGRYPTPVVTAENRDGVRVDLLVGIEPFALRAPR